MKRKSKDLTLEYLNKRIGNLFKEFRKFEDICYKWKRKDMEDIAQLKQKIKEK